MALLVDLGLRGASQTMFPKDQLVTRIIKVRVLVLAAPMGQIQSPVLNNLIDRITVNIFIQCGYTGKKQKRSCGTLPPKSLLTVLTQAQVCRHGEFA